MCDKKHENKHQVKEDETHMPLSSMACVFHPPLPGVCFHALCQTLFLSHILLYISFRIIALFPLLFAF